MDTKTFGNPVATLYAAAVATTELLGVEDTRKGLAGRVKLADEQETHTVVTLHGQPAAVLVDIGWYIRARESLGDPTDLRVGTAKRKAASE